MKEVLPPPYQKEKDMSYYTLRDGEKLYYEDKGHGQDTLIMMHGWTSSHDIYTKPAELLQDRARCIIYDHRGHKGSREANSGSPDMDTLAGDLKDIIGGLSLSDITLLGWSMGAGVIFDYVRLYGCENLKRIVLCDMTPKLINDDEWKLGLLQGRYTKEDMERDAGKPFYPLFKEFVTGTIPMLKRVPGFLLKRPLQKVLSECNEPVLKSLAASMEQQDYRSVVGQITVPVTYFYADPGSLFSPELADWYKEHVKTEYNAVRFPKSTHMFIKDYPEKFAKEVRKVIDSP